jgi:hypothetical protein
MTVVLSVSDAPNCGDNAGVFIYNRNMFIIQATAHFCIENIIYLFIKQAILLPFQ